MNTPLPSRIVPILAGGGTRLTAHVGVLKALHDLGIGYQHLVGVSGGSVVAALAAVGQSPEHMKHLLRDLDFRQFRGHSLANLVLRGGLSNGRRLERWVDGELGGARFRDLDVDLRVVATDLRAGRPVIFDRRTSPDLQVARAVLYSVSLPPIFPFHRQGSQVLVDGSILAEDGLLQDWAGDRTPVVCFRLRDIQGAADPAPRRILPVADDLFMLIRAFVTTRSREYLSEALWPNAVVIETEGLSPLEFHLTAEQKTILFLAGYHTTLDFLPVKLARLAARTARAGA